MQAVWVGCGIGSVNLVEKGSALEPILDWLLHSRNNKHGPWSLGPP
ncbi:hypothetical protein SAMN02746041_01267 [Desulfacinum hydrothermale DSM 13146]|uniref:Uncharacterized protein n=1 Tax=Desulfacinum hydrothermale DSM 13146 TaxID=1121390 RepID=A0A1W1XCR5_9BACT|nr:hypothetical protein SAMN02746041_01267 [Desulfacinum hydrothermale DSM 13146]